MPPTLTSTSATLPAPTAKVVAFDLALHEIVGAAHDVRHRHAVEIQFLQALRRQGPARWMRRCAELAVKPTGNFLPLRSARLL